MNSASKAKKVGEAGRTNGSALLPLEEPQGQVAENEHAHGVHGEHNRVLAQSQLVKASSFDEVFSIRTIKADHNKVVKSKHHKLVLILNAW
jgi:hypothetical protein